MLFFLDLSKLNPFRFQSVSKLIVELTESKKNFNLINPSSKMRGFIFEKKTCRSGISTFLLSRYSNGIRVHLQVFDVLRVNWN